MIKKILENGILVLLNLLGLVLGIILGLIFVHNIDSKQDNHFLGGLIILVKMVIGMGIGIGIGVSSTILITVVYIVRKNRKKR